LQLHYSGALFEAGKSFLLLTVSALQYLLNSNLKIIVGNSSGHTVDKFKGPSVTLKKGFLALVKKKQLQREAYCSKA
jgi:hypothetical protein